MTPPASVWHVAREYAGFAEAGGVKDVVRGLAEALARRGVPTTVVLPLYGFMKPQIDHGKPAAAFSVPLADHDRENRLFEEPVQVFPADVHGVRLLFVESPRYARLRDVYTYTTKDEEENHWRKKGTGHWDSHQLNVLLQVAALETSARLGEQPAVFHCHDGHTAFLPALMKEMPLNAKRFPSSAAVLTIHNAGRGYHQEIWSPQFASLLTGLPQAAVEKGMLGGMVDPLLLAGFYASLVTVSKQYARELIAEKGDEMTGGLGKAYRECGIRLSGITNGIDPTTWDPRDPGKSGLPFRFDPSTGDLDGKRKCRQGLLTRLGLPAESSPAPLFAFVGRLTGQKGVDVLFGSLKEILSRKESPFFIVLGTGEKEKEAMFAWLAERPETGGRLCFLPRYDPDLAKLIYAASDFFLIPSAYEPCGLTDFISQILGSIPIVHRVGGLVKVRDGETGLSYEEQSPTALSAVVEKAARMFASDTATLETIRRRAFTEIFSEHTWDRVLEEGYLPLYQDAMKENPWTRR